MKAWVQRIRIYRSYDRSEFAFYQLENERRRQAFRDEGAGISRSMRHYRARLRNWLGSKRISWKFLSMAIIFVRGRDLVLMVRAVTIDIKRRMRTHSARQLDCVPLQRSTRNGPMYLGSSLLLPTLVTTCFGRFTVDSRTKSPTSNRRTSALPCLSALRFFRHTTLAMESCTKRSTASHASKKYSAESPLFVAVRLVRTAKRLFSSSASVFSSLLV